MSNPFPSSLEPTKSESTPYLAQEIINLITDHLSYDEDTLALCSVVSSSFHVSCRRHLFSSIHLYSIRMIILFHRLLAGTPDVAWCVRELLIAPYLQDESYMDDVSGQKVTSDALLGSSPILPDIFTALSGISSISWSMDFWWQALSSELQSAFIGLLQRPSLTTIHLPRFVGFPILALGRNQLVSTVKRLDFSRHNSEEGRVFLPYLEKLGVRSLEPGFEFVVPKLQRLVFSDLILSNDTASSMQQLINASGSSLQRLRLGLICTTRLEILNFHISLDKLYCLQFLSLEFRTIQGISNIAGFLRGTPLMHTLQYLAIWFRPLSYQLGDSYWPNDKTTKSWKDLDLALSSFLVLRHVLIDYCPDIGCLKPIPSELLGFRAALQEFLPLLEKRGILKGDVNTPYSKLMYDMRGDDW